MTFGERLKRAREAKGFTQAELAFIIRGRLPGAGVTANQVSSWERNEHTPRALYRNVLASILGDPTLVSPDSDDNGGTLGEPSTTEGIFASSDEADSQGSEGQVPAPEQV